MNTTATKNQMAEFISANFVTPEGDHPSKSQLSDFKKNELASVIENAGAADEFDEFLKK